ncbi:hypothetical protein [Pseudomonas monteilii]|uniref:hypothetical protein n=1 Tax=Pseudomonas monteilii TaxID=76759 RepID=UPI001378080E|nr:hypothetical protein [Pseudomonas monteilii]NBB06666.1 hypothetical protein [Pseudomonas monteilii]
MDGELHSDDQFSFSRKNEELFVKHFPAGLSEEAAVLKAHLYVETLLRDFCLRSVRNPAHLQEARLSFKQVTQLARSLCVLDGENFDFCWLLVEKLNTLRNMMAHELEPDPARMSKARNAMLTIAKQSRSADEPDIGTFAECVGYLCGVVDALLQTSLAMAKHMTTSGKPKD